ncbi:MAG: hypothetical protein JWM81_136 [Candidatus Saccharibacteria bacterium]|nr:hypothetical protein [Candidatus Saccharibacteria bacterium]
MTPQKTKLQEVKERFLYRAGVKEFDWNTNGADQSEVLTAGRQRTIRHLGIAAATAVTGVVLTAGLVVGESKLPDDSGVTPPDAVLQTEHFGEAARQQQAEEARKALEQQEGGPAGLPGGPVDNVTVSPHQ